MSYTVTVALSFRRGCATCVAEAESTAIQGIRDPQVTQVTLRVVPRCAHEERTQLGAGPIGPAPAALRAAGQSVLMSDLRLGQLPLSDVNGNIDEEVMNGFDVEVRQ